MWSRLYNSRGRVCVASRVRLAAGFVARAVGLLGRSRLEDGEGIVLRPCRSVHTCFMCFPIDILFLDFSGRVLAVRRSIAPFRLCVGPAGAGQVVELSAGTADRLGIAVGDLLFFEEGNSEAGSALGVSRGAKDL